MNYEKTAGIANIAYSALLIITGILFYLLFPVTEISINYSRLVTQPGWVPINIITMIATVFGVIGLFGMYIKQVNKSRLLTSVGFIISLFGLVMKASATSWEFTIWPAILHENPENVLLTESLIYKNINILSFYGVFTLFFIVGYLVFGIGSIKAKIFPKWASILLIIGGPAYAILLSIPPFGLLGMVLYCAGILGFGLSLLKNQKGEV